ncbi:filamentous hemagglutinin N-terminal domain-containing protein [Megasphaera elsdenii]|uniref:two-partner secretion domain-containing protein n=1 Tax=Megasphaera elsdenii TaxID=907 RepID=UPI0033966523
MKYYSKKQWTQKLTVMVLLSMALGGTAVQAMPSGADIRSGQGSISQDGKNMTVQQNSQRMAIDWTKFDIAKDETVRYAQPDRNAISLNRVTGGQQSVIAGNLNANGNVVLVNPNGVVFTKNSSVDVGGLVASTARLNDEAMKNFGNGKDSLGLSLDKDSTASVINEGQIKAQGGLVALHAANVENKGTITNEGGTLAMAAAKNLTLSAADDDKLNFTVDGELAKSQALNSGSLKADGGYVVMTAKSAGDVLSTVVNNTGTIEAKTLRKNEKGQILLDGGKSGQVEVSGTLDASGTEEGQSAGNIKVIGEKTIVHDGTNLLARGNVDGGKIETSGDVLNLGDNLNIDASGNRGSHGTWLLDPLEVVISASKPSSADHEYSTIVGDTDGKTKNNVIYNDPPSKQNANDAYNSTTWIDSNQVGTILSKGTDVMIQAISSSGAASITLESPIDITVSNSASKNPTFTLEANRNITINQNITAESSGKGLNIMLNADTDGDNIGAVIMNADVTTNGGWFKSATGGNVTHTYGTSDADKKNYGTYNGVKVGGGPNHDGSTVGTYFGGKDTAKQAENRFIKTNGGAITLNGEVAIGLNGGTLTLDTGGGDLTVTGLINSGNSYKAYIYGTDDWNNNKMIQEMVNQYLEDGTVPAYHYIGITYERDSNGNLIEDGKGGYKWSYTAKNYTDGNIHYVLKALTDTSDSSVGKDFSTINPRWYTTTDAGYGYDSFIVDKASTITVDEYLAYVKKSAPGNFKSKYNADTYDAIKNDATKMATLRADIAELIAHNWFLAEQIAENGTSGGAEVRDSYLATITTRLENSLSTPNGQHTLWVGGRGSGVRGRTVNDDPNNPATWGPSDPTLMDGFYWVTGPEGAASTYKDSEGNTLKYDAGTKFWDTVSSDWKTGKNGEKAYGLDPTWSTYKSGEKKITQPDNNGPFLTVGYGSDNQWDDANFGGETTWGFVQETNLANSSLKISTGKGTVALKGDIGKGQALDTLSIDGGTVKIGDTSNKVTDYNHGTVYVDHGLKITGTGNVTVGGEIHSGENPETDTSTTLEDTYKDNVTILSSGNIEVHGITSNTYDDGTTTTRGGKISLTSTGKTGKITLGAGVDYNGNATDGTLAAASTAAGAVVVDAQGSQGSLVNRTKGTAAITTGTDGTWQVYVNSPSDYDTSLGNNLNSNTNAQWTAKSGSNTTVKTNSSNNTLSDYTVTSSNKFIFQVTPVITISGGNQKKTYGDTLTDDQLRKLLSTSATYTDSTGKDVDVTQFGNFKEANYLTYVTSSDGTKTGTDAVAVSSGGAFATATRTDGNEKNLGTDDYKTASDGNRAFYVFNVEEDGAKALNGYDLKTVNGDIEILRKTLTINTDATQTYGNDAVTSGTPEADSTQLVNGDTLDTGSISYKIATDGKYADSKGRNDTAHVGSYENQYLTTGATVKASDGSDASANYAVTGSGTITVNPADLYLKVRDVSTTYGTAFDDTKYGYTVDSDKRGLVNGDTQDAVLGDQFLSYTNNGNATDPDKIAKGAVTQNVGNYELLGTANRTLADYNVHITSGTATVNKAKLALTVGDTSTTYGSGDWTPYTYTLTGNANGDTVDSVKENGITAVYTNTGAVTDAASNEKKIYTKDADGKYQLLGDFTLTGQTAKNYEIETNTPGKATVNKATVKVKLNDVSTTYGTAFDTDKYGYDPSKIEGLTNGDKTDVVTQVLNGDYKTGNIQYTNTGDASAEEKLDGKVTKTVNGGPYYLQGTTSQTLGNYNIEIENGNATINKATLHLSTGNYTETYGDAETVQKDLDRATTVTGEKNGDNLADLVSKIGIRNTSEALLSDTRTNDVKYKADGSLDNYGITTDFNKSLDNYDVVQDKTGSVTLTPVEITVDNEMIQTYGSKDRSFKEVVDPGLVNGDKISTDGLKMAPKAGGKYETNKGNRTTADAGIYKDDLTFSGGIVHADGTTDASKNYKVTIKGDIIVNKAPLYVNTDDILTYYGVVKNTQSRVTGLTNGDQADGIQYGYGDYGHGYLNGNTTTNMPGNYAFGTSLSGPDFLKNYNIIGGNANLQIIQSKPDQTTHYVEGAHRPQDKLESALPVFRVDASGVVKQYGTYGIESQSQAVTLSPTGMRMPEPNQTSTQDRKYLTTLKTAHGHGTFRLEYNGVVLRVIPVDPAAEQIVEAGDKLKNVALSEQALHAAYTQMGLDLVNLKGVYIYMAPM